MALMNKGPKTLLIWRWNISKVQKTSASEFRLSSARRKQEVEDSDKESDEEVSVQALHHRREINKKTRSGDKKLQKKLNSAKKVHPHT